MSKSVGRVLALVHPTVVAWCAGEEREPQMAMVIDPMQAGSAMPLFRQTPRRTLNGELVVRLLPQDFCHCQR